VIFSARMALLSTVINGEETVGVVMKRQISNCKFIHLVRLFQTFNLSDDTFILTRWTVVV
jgi:hypothetical protein